MKFLICSHCLAQIIYICIHTGYVSTRDVRGRSAKITYFIYHFFLARHSASSTLFLLLFHSTRPLHPHLWWIRSLKVRFQVGQQTAATRFLCIYGLQPPSESYQCNWFSLLQNKVCISPVTLEIWPTKATFYENIVNF